MKLAGNAVDHGYMTKYGEVMMKSGINGSENDIGWILPVTRIQDEFGMQTLYKHDGSAVLIAPNGEQIPFRKHQGLNFLDWEIFDEIKAQLRKSHLDGRSSMPPIPHEVSIVPIARCNQVICSSTGMVSQSTQT